jgi:phage replication O-like protein O
LEHGYLRVANELWEALTRAPLPGRELRVVMAVMRKTYGYGQKSAEISFAELCALSGIPHRQNLMRVLVALESQRIVHIQRRGTRPSVYEVNKDFEAWTVTPEGDRTVTSEGYSRQSPVTSKGYTTVTSQGYTTVTPGGTPYPIKDMKDMKDMRMEGLRIHPLVKKYCELFTIVLNGPKLTAANGAAVDLEKHPKYDLDIARTALALWFKHCYRDWVEAEHANGREGGVPNFGWLIFKAKDALDTGQMPGQKRKHRPEDEPYDRARLRNEKPFIFTPPGKSEQFVVFVPEATAKAWDDQSDPNFMLDQIAVYIKANPDCIFIRKSDSADAHGMFGKKVAA